MKKLLISIGIWTAALLSTQQITAQSLCDHRQGASNNNFIPNFAFQVTPATVICDSAYSFSAELGRKNYRFGGTVGTSLGDWGLVKLSGEYLTQDIEYRFASGSTSKWRPQGAIGLAYTKDLDLSCFEWCPPLIYNWLSFIEINGYWSYAPNKNLSAVTCANGNTVLRHIAGSNAAGVAIGVSCIPWSTGRFSAQTTYDYVSYARKYKGHRHIGGFGSTYSIIQCLPFNLDLELSAAFKEPYNYYLGSVNYAFENQWRGLIVGVFGAYLKGRFHLPNSSTAGIQLSYRFGCEGNGCMNMGDWGYGYNCDNNCCDPRLMEWVSNSAVYIPEVLANSFNDQRIIVAPQ